MKTTLLLLFNLLFTTLFYSQSFPGNDIELLSNKELKVLPKIENLKKFGFPDFYKDEYLKDKYECCESYHSKYLSLVDKTFKLISYVQYKNSIGYYKFKLKLYNPETEIVYFDYDPEDESKFPFEVVGGLNPPEGYYCKDIVRHTDKFTGEIKYISEDLEGILFLKIIKDKTIKNYIVVRQYAPTLHIGKKGLIILLDNNKRIEKLETKIDATSSYKGYIYSTLVELNANDLILLRENKITDVRVYIYDATITFGDKLKEYVKCLNKIND